MPKRLFKAADNDLQIAWGVVYMPGIPDVHNDYMVEDEIREMAHKFLAEGDTHSVDLNHNNKLTGARVVESFIVREGDPDFDVPGSWVVGVHVPDPDLWHAIKKGEVNGFSMEALVMTKDGEVDAFNFPGSLAGMTMAAGLDDHVHTFEALYDAEGKLLGGKTSVHRDEQGREHFHLIRRGVASEEADGHAHRFDSISGFQAMEAANA